MYIFLEILAIISFAGLIATIKTEEKLVQFYFSLTSIISNLPLLIIEVKNNDNSFWVSLILLVVGIIFLFLTSMSLGESIEKYPSFKKIFEKYKKEAEN